MRAGTGYDLHMLTKGQHKIGVFVFEWYSMHLNQEFLDALDKYGPPPTDLNYDMLMQKLIENKT